MRFTEIKINEYVKFNENIKYLYFRLAEDFLWIDESLECILEVKDIDLDKHRVKMSCVDDCGTHAKLDFTEEEYNEMCYKLGMDALKTSSFQEVLCPTREEVAPAPYELTVEDNRLIVSKFLDALVD